MSKPYPQLLLFGDSIIEQSSLLRDGFSFGSALSEHCNRRYDIINRGLSGYNTANATLVLQDIIPSPEQAKVAYLLILFGANDSCLPGYPSRQHVSLKSYKENIKSIINQPVVKAQDPTIFLVTPPPINETQLLSNDLRHSREQSVTAQYANTIRAIAAELKGDKVVLIDLHSALMEKAISLTPGYSENRPLLGTLQSGDSAGLRSLLVDGLHLTGAGYKIFVEKLLPHVERPPTVFPLWPSAPRNDSAL